MASEGVELAIAGVQLVQKIFQDKVLIDHGWSELSDLKTEIGVSLTELQSLKAWLEDTNPPRHKVVAAVGLGQKIADLVKDFECNMKGFCKELEGAHADAGLREAAWMKFKDAVKHIGRGGAGVPGVLVEETARMDAKLKEINDKLRNFVSAS